MVVASLRLEQLVYKSAFLSGTGYAFSHSDSGARLGILFCCQNRAANERCYYSCSGPAACLLKQTVSDSKVNAVSHFQSGTGYLFVWKRIAKLCLFSLEQGQVPRHSAAQPQGEGPVLTAGQTLHGWGVQPNKRGRVAFHKVVIFPNPHIPTYPLLQVDSDYHFQLHTLSLSQVFVIDHTFCNCKVQYHLKQWIILYMFLHVFSSPHLFLGFAREIGL